MNVIQHQIPYTKKLIKGKKLICFIDIYRYKLLHNTNPVKNPAKFPFKVIILLELKLMINAP